MTAPFQHAPIERTIVSAVIISADNKILFGKKDQDRGGVYLDKWHIPGGGIEEGEDQLMTLKREVMEETGLDINTAKISFLDDLGTATVPKKLPSGQVAPCRMTFLVYRVDLTESASDSRVKAGDDFAELVWVPLEKITEYELTPPSISLFLRLGWLTAEQALQQRQFTDANQHPVAYTSEEISWRVSVYAVIIRDGQLLCIKNKKEELFDLIGGGIEFGENLEEAMYREGLEEAGAKIKLGRHLETSIDWFFHKRGTFHQTLQLFYRAELIGELMDPTDPDIESVEWISLADVGTKYHFPPVVERILLSEGRKES